MTWPVVYREEVPDEINEAIAWYENQQPGRGHKFLVALQEQIQRIADNPELYGTILRDVRAAPLRRYPYVVYYRKESQRIVIIAVQHGQRSSRKWRRRI